MRAFIDSNIFVYAAQAHPEFGGACKKIIKDIELREIEAVTSVLNIAEVAEFIDRNENRKAATNVIELLLALPMDIEDVVKEHEVDALSIFSASKANYFDTIFIAVMNEKFIDTIITNDSHFEGLKGIKVIKPLDYLKINV
ncbi:MAG: type II toxin-antitoxin system VapC family toxin [Candidatus Aenigmarchaeota archaeon]|nr:type II toxin-antitoxin system VapC family toxin [Candidatus Aenigmarchaeota archaeon]